MRLSRFRGRVGDEAAGTDLEHAPLGHASTGDAKSALNDPLDETLDIFAISDEEPADAKRDIGKLLEQLPDRHRLPIVHVKLEGLSVTETATLTGMSESAVKVGIHRGLKALAAKIRGTA